MVACLMAYVYTVDFVKELGPHGITINVISLVLIRSSLTVRGSALAKRFQKKKHIEREGTNRKLAAVTIFLSKFTRGHGATG